MSDSRQIESELNRAKDILHRKASDVIHWATQIKSATNTASLNNCLSSLEARAIDLKHQVQDVARLEADLKRAQEAEKREKEAEARRKTDTRGR